MTSKLARVLSVVLVVGLGAASGLAQVVTPVSVTASSTYVSYNVNNLIDNSGLTPADATGRHDEDYHNMWLSNAEITPWLVFDLGSDMAITAAYIWQYNATCCGLERGIRGLDISVSTNNVTFTPVTSVTLTESLGGNIPAQIVTFTANGRYVKFQATSNWGDDTYTGLSEVKFNGPEAPPVQPTAVPFLSTWGAIALAAILLAAALIVLRR